MARIDIVIVNWNSGDFLRDCVASLCSAHAARPDLIGSVTVVDNGSHDDSLSRMQYGDLPLRIVRNTDNRGFGAACNQGAAGGEAGYLLFLNPDAAASAEALRGPVDYLERPANRRVGICGVQLLDESGRVARSCARFPSPAMFFHGALGLDRIAPGRFPRARMAEWDHGCTRQVDQVIGAYFLVRRPLFEQLGGFDERYFVYFEEVDFSCRARERGFVSVYLAGVQARHRGGGSSDKVRAHRLYYSLRSRLLYSFRHFSKFGALSVVLVTLFVEPVGRLAHAMLVGSPRSAAETIRGYAWLWRWLPRYVFLGRSR